VSRAHHPQPGIRLVGGVCCPTKSGISIKSGVWMWRKHSFLCLTFFPLIGYTKLAPGNPIGSYNEPRNPNTKPPKVFSDIRPAEWGCSSLPSTGSDPKGLTSGLTSSSASSNTRRYERAKTWLLVTWKAAALGQRWILKLSRSMGPPCFV
jgi:hypothetical protein